MSEQYACSECDFSVPELEPRMFSFNAPFGACSDCKGIGVKYKIDEDLVIPDKNNIYFLVEVLSSPPIYIGNDNFTDWLDRFNDWVLDEYKFIENVILEKCDLI